MFTYFLHKLRMRHHRICQFEQKLTKEKNLRSEIEAELQLKEDLIDSKGERNTTFDLYD